MSLVRLDIPRTPANACSVTVTAKDLGLVGCRRCAKAWPRETSHCGRCGIRLVSRDHHSLQKVWAFWIAGVMCYIPGNAYPMLQTRTFLSEDASTIMGGVIELLHYGEFVVALIIFVASIVIPVGKFLAVAYLALSVKGQAAVSKQGRMGLFEIVEYIGRWSMVDVFVVAILSALVQLGAVVSIAPGPASLFFALSVIFTMLSAQSFDSRLIWDDLDRPRTVPKDIADHA